MLKENIKKKKILIELDYSLLKAVDKLKKDLSISRRKIVEHALRELLEKERTEDERSRKKTR